MTQVRYRVTAELVVDAPTMNHELAERFASQELHKRMKGDLGVIPVDLDFGDGRIEVKDIDFGVVEVFEAEVSA